MGANDLEKSMSTVLGDTKSPVAKAVRLMGVMVDEKLTSMAESNEEQHSEVLKAIQKVDQKLDSQQKALDVVVFFQNHPAFFWIIVAAFLVMIGLDARDLIVKYINI